MTTCVPLSCVTPHPSLIFRINISGAMITESHVNEMYIHVFRIIVCSLNRCKFHFDICKQHPLRLDLHSSHMGGPVAQWVMSLDLTTHTSLSPIRRGFAPSFVNYKKGCTRLAAASDKVYLLLVQGRWFSPASSTTKTFRQNIAEILLKVTLSTQIHSFFSYAKRFMCFR